MTESYRIGKYEVTIGEYTAFLDAVAAEDPAGLYHEGMAQDRTSAGITRTSTAAGFTYAVTGPAGITPPGATRQDVAPTNNAAATGVPVVNYLQGVIYSVTQSAVFSTTQNYLTDVGAFATTTSHYGTLDQNGNVYEWNDLTGAAGRLRGLRGVFWAGGAIALQKFTFTQVTAGREANDAGFRLVSSAASRPA